MNSIKNYTGIVTVCLLLLVNSTNAFGSKIKKEEVISEYAFKPGKQLTVSNQIGKIKVEGWDQDKIQVKIVKKGPEDKLSLVTIERFFGDTKAKLKTAVDQKNQPSFSPLSWFRKTNISNIQVDYSIKIPQKTAVIIKAKQGEIAVKNISDSLSIKTEQATIAVNSLAGNLTIFAQQADTAAKTIQGAVNIQSIRGDIELNQIAGPVKMQLTEGDIIAHNINGSLHAKSKKSDVIAESVTESVSIAIEDGAVSLKDIKGPIEVITQRGDIEIENAENSALVKTEKGSVRFIKKSKSGK